jgi:ATP synthase protein I
MTTEHLASEIGAEVDDFKPLTAEEAQRLREANPSLSPWWVIVAQVVVGMLVSAVALLWVREWSAAWSAMYGALAVALPAALFVRGTRMAAAASMQSAAMLRFAVWELIKLVLSIAMLAAAPLLVGDLRWLALLAGVIAAMKMYWVALVVRPRWMNRK